MHAEAQVLAPGAAQQQQQMRGRRRGAQDEGIGCPAKPTDSFSEDSGRGVSEPGANALRLNGVLLVASGPQNPAFVHAATARALSTGQNPRLLHFAQDDPHRY